jgi:hypothetical protein
MRIFFSLAPHFMTNQDYESSVRNMARTFNLDPVFAHERPENAEAHDWIASRVAECQFAFLDLTGLAAEVVYALGVASQSEDATVRAFIDTVEHQRTGIKAGPMLTSIIEGAQKFVGADDFQRKAQMFIRDSAGGAQLRDGALIARIKDGIAKKGPIQMRQLAIDIGRPMPEVQPVVYDLVKKGEIKKISDKRWTQYRT